MSYTSLLNTATLSEFTDLVEKEFVYQQEMYQPQAQKLFISQNLAYHNGDTKRYDEVDVQTFATLKGEGDDATRVESGVGYNKTMTAKRVATEIQITWEMRNYNKQPDIVSKMTNLSHFGPQRLELDLTHRFTFAGSTSYVDLDGETIDISTGDSLALCYSAHTLAGSAVTYRNRVSGDPVFSQGALEAAELLAKTETLSNFGEMRTMNFNKIVCANNPSVIRDIKQVMESTADVDSANSGVMNYYAGAYELVVLPYLATTATGAYDSTKRNYWFIASTGNGADMSWQAYLGIFEPNNLKTPIHEDEHNDNWTYGSRMSYGICTLSGRGLIGSLPTS